MKAGLSIITVLLFVSNVHSVQVVKTKFETCDLVLAEEIIEPGDKATSDCSAVLQAGIDRVAERGGGTVFLSAGQYTIDQPITVKEGVTLRGDLPPDVSKSSCGTVLRITAGKGDENDQAVFTVQRGSGLRGLTFWYPEQNPAAPIKYPWTVHTAQMDANDNQSVFDCVFVNAWQAICIGPEGNELHTFRNLNICALKTGIFIDSTTDIGRIANVSISPDIWTQCDLPGSPRGDAVQTLQRWLLDSECSGLIIGRSDWEYIWRLKVNGYNRGIVFKKGKRGTTNAVMAESDVSACTTALYVEALNQVGLSVYNTRLHGLEYAALTSEEFSNMVQFHSCGFKGAVVKHGEGIFSLKNCSMEEVTADRGEILMSDCSFRRTVLAQAVRRARIFGFNKETCQVENFSEGGDIAICSFRLNDVKTDLVVPTPAVTPRPGSDALFVVTDFGASIKLDDNAEAFQRTLDAAGQNRGGGTVYVPAGYYKFQNDITVPSGVELRGCFDVPHHTVSDGSVLMPCHNAGQEDGPAFVKLESGSGLRGLSFWYPQQPLSAPVAYPWCVQSQGKGCWIVDTNIGNGWQGVDFASHRSDAHVIQYLSGAMYKRGLFVGNSQKSGCVEDVQFNPHYMGRRSKTLPYTAGPGWKGENRDLIEYQRQHLKGIVFKDCRRENIRASFLYAAFEGIAFYGKCDADILMHGSDTVSRAAYLNMDGGGSLRFALAQLVSLGKFMEGAIVSSEKNRGVAWFQNSQMWAGDSTALLNGSGLIYLEQFNTVSGPVTVNSGGLGMELGVFVKPLSEQIAAHGSVDLSAVACVNQHGPFCVRVENAPVRLLGNSSTPRAGLPSVDKDSSTIFLSSFESGEPAVPLCEIASPGGGLHQVSNSQTLTVKRDDALSGDQALLFKGHSDDPAYSYAYHVISSQPVAVFPDTKLVYGKKPLNENGRNAAVDLYFKSQRVLRMLPCGRAHHAGTKAGAVGEWTRVEVPLGSLCGDVIEKVMVAYDTRKGGGPFELLFDDVAIRSQLSTAGWQVQANPVGGDLEISQVITIQSAADVVVHYTLDGSNPTLESSHYTAPLTLPRKGPVELRYAPVGLDGAISSAVFSAIYEVR